MPFEQFLREFQAILHRGLSKPEEEEGADEEEEADEARKDPENPKAIAKQASKKALDYVFALKREELDKFRPTQKQTKDFVDELQSAILKEDKTLSPDRVQALRKVLVYNEAPGKSRFADIDPHVFAFQLALRIREPSLMDQKESGECAARLP